MKVFSTLFLLLIITLSGLSQNSFDRRTINSDVIVEGRVIEKQSYWNADKSRIYTSNMLEVYKVFKGTHSSVTTIEFITVGGIIETQFQFETHSLQVGKNQMGIFFLRNSNIENPLSDQNLTIIEEDYFIPYRINRNYFEASDEGTIYTNPIKEIYAPLEIATGVTFTHIKNNLFENKIEEWLNDNLTFSTTTDNLIEFSFDDIVVNGTSDVDFNVYVKSNQQGIKFAASDVFIDYSHEAFGYSVVSNNNVTGDKRDVIDNAIYTLVLTDATSERIKIEVASVFQPTDLYELSLYPEKFCHMTLSIQDVYALASMSFNNSMMSDQSFFYDPATNSYVPFDKIGVSNPVLPFALPQISTLSPDPITAGTGDILTITGSNFGSHNPLSCNGCKVKFADGDNEGFGEAYAQYQDIVSWTDTEIQVRVPSTTNTAGFKHPAATGGVWVERPNDIDPNIIEKSNEEDIHIMYSVLNNRNGITPIHPIKRFAISNQTTDGITFQYSSNVPTEIKNLFKSAVTNWCGHTQIAWKISDDVAPGSADATDMSGNDGINVVIMKPPSEFPSSIARASVVISGHFNLCSNNLTPLYINDIDIKISNEFNSFTDGHEEKWYNYILHELGHAHGLNHSKNPTISTSEEYIMNSSANNWTSNTFHSIQSDDATGANTCFAASQNILSDPECSNVAPISTHLCGDINSTIKAPDFIASFTVIPNPVRLSNFLVRLSSTKHENVMISVNNNIGQLIHRQEFKLNEGENLFQVDFEKEISAGVYYVSLQKDNTVITQKLIKL